MYGAQVTPPSGPQKPGAGEGEGARELQSRVMELEEEVGSGTLDFLSFGVSQPGKLRRQQSCASSEPQAPGDDNQPGCGLLCIQCMLLRFSASEPW